MHHYLDRLTAFKIADTINEHENIADILDYNASVISSAIETVNLNAPEFLKQFTRAAQAPALLNSRQKSSLPDILDKSVAFWKLLKSQSRTPDIGDTEFLDQINQKLPAVLITNLIASRLYSDSESSPEIQEIDHIMPLLGWQDTWPPLSRIATDPDIPNAEINAIYTQLSCFEERMAHPYMNSTIVHTPLAGQTTPPKPPQFLQ